MCNSIQDAFESHLSFKISPLCLLKVVPYNNPSIRSLSWLLGLLNELVSGEKYSSLFFHSGSLTLQFILHNQLCSALQFGFFFNKADLILKCFGKEGSALLLCRL